MRAHNFMHHLYFKFLKSLIHPWFVVAVASKLVDLTTTLIFTYRI